MFLPVQRGGIAALEEGDTWFSTLNEEYSKRKSLVCKILDDLGCTYSSEQAGLFVWARIAEGQTSSEDFCDAILNEAKVFLAPGTIFGSNGEGYVRVSLCSSIDTLTEAVKRIREYMRDFKS